MLRRVAQRTVRIDFRGASVSLLALAFVECELRSLTAAATSGANTEFKRECIDRARSVRSGGADRTFSDSVADADVHGSVGN